MSVAKRRRLAQIHRMRAGEFVRHGDLLFAKKIARAYISAKINLNREAVLLVIERMQGIADRLTLSEQQLVHEIMARPQEVALGTASELARAAGVHEATATRLAKKLGFKRYKQLRDALREEFIVTNEPALRVQRSLGDLADGDVIGRLVTQEMEALAALPKFLDNDSLVNVADALTLARKIHLYAVGNSMTLAVMMERRLRRFGLDVRIMGGSGRDLAEQALAIGQGDVLFSFAFRHCRRSLAKLLAHTRSADARSVVIAGTVAPMIQPVPDFLLSAPRAGSFEAFQTQIVPMTICNALVLTIASRNEFESLATLETLGEFLQEFDEDVLE